MSDFFLAELAKPQPDPGGGAAAAHGALIALALLKKIFMLEYTRIQTKTHSENWENKKIELDSLGERMESLREEDRKIYPRLTQFRKSESNGEKFLKIVEDSITVPLQIMKGAIEGLAIIIWLGGHCKEILKADLRVSAELLEAALRGTYYIGRANLPLSRKLALPVIFEQELQNKLQEGQKAFQQAITVLHPTRETISDDSYCR
ncbi:MAG TPA: cyclodeaminase/cyclohydrolase family protein [Thermodesulfobacteriota bacterium]|nr:cyclodeaminase/cyclohydrolase family protein [Thermodesulfobacteriota bacterium]